MAALPLIAIVGPTASGKSSLAEAVACRLNTEVVSVDAMQVYRGMDIGTAKTPRDKRLVPLHMIDVVEPHEDYSAQRFQHDARKIIDELLGEQKTPVLCGGTGLYLNAVIDQWDFPRGERQSALREALEQRAKREGSEALYAELVEKDPQSAQCIHPHNVRRVIRALEMHAEGVSYAEQSRNLRSSKAYYSACVWGLTMDRGQLYERINCRVDEMMAEGLLEEVRALVLDGKLLANTTAGQAIGYKELLGVVHGTASLCEAVEEIKLRTRRYAKRQLSWFKRDSRVRWINLDEVSQDEAVSMISDAHSQASHE